MEFISILFMDIFANSVLMSGKAVKDSVNFAKERKYRWILILFFFLESLALGALGYLLNSLSVKYEILSYFSILFAVLLIALFIGLYSLLIEKVLPEKIRVELKDDYLYLFINSALMACFLPLSTLTDLTNVQVLAHLFGFPLGFICSILIIQPVLERIQISKAGKGFKGIPLLLIALGALALSLTYLTF